MRRLDRIELAALVALSGLSVLVLAALLTKGRALTGADGLLASDQLQYLTWIRQAGDHGLIGNEYDLAPDHRVFLHPGFLLSGVLHAVAGISVPLSYLLWKPVAVGLLFWGVLAYARRLLPPGGPRYAALVLGVFAVMPASALVAWSGWGGKPRQFTFDFIAGELGSAPYLWGYLMTAIAVGLMPLVLLAVEDARRSRRRAHARARRRGRAARHLAAAVAGRHACARHRRRRGGPLAARGRAAHRRGSWWCSARSSPPAVYYAILERTDAAWELAGKANAAGNQATWSWPWWAIALTLAPLALPAALAYRTPARELAGRRRARLAVRGAGGLPRAGRHVPVPRVPGMTIPLAVLAVQGVLSVAPRPRRRSSSRASR